jgi:hypothetical protein
MVVGAFLVNLNVSLPSPYSIPISLPYKCLCEGVSPKQSPRGCCLPFYKMFQLKRRLPKCHEVVRRQRAERRLVTTSIYEMYGREILHESHTLSWNYFLVIITLTKISPVLPKKQSGILHFCEPTSLTPRYNAPDIFETNFV